MRPTYQTAFTGPQDDGTFVDRGNCLMACVASILEVPLETLPVLGPEHDDGSWWGILAQTLNDHGYGLVYSDNAPAILPTGYHIAGGPSPRGPWGHAVVALDGKVVHDPHPSQAGVVSVERWYLIYPLDRQTSRRS